jgi:hypothetical protein
MIDLAILISVRPFRQPDPGPTRGWRWLVKLTENNARARNVSPIHHLCRSSCFLKQLAILLTSLRRPGRDGSEQHKLLSPSSIVNPKSISPGVANVVSPALCVSAEASRAGGARPATRTRAHVRTVSPWADVVQNKLFTPDHAIKADYVCF